MSAFFEAAHPNSQTHYALFSKFCVAGHRNAVSPAGLSGVTVVVAVAAIPAAGALAGLGCTDTQREL